MSYNLTGATVSSTYPRLVQVVLGTPDLYYDGLGNLLNLGSGTAAVGPQGATGPQGSVGPQGPTGSNGNSVNYEGIWDPNIVYVPLDIVTYNGNAYIAISTSTSEPGPPYDDPSITPTVWQLLTYGITGSSGPQGVTGPTGSIEFYFQTTPPATPSNLGARWIDSDNGFEYVWVYDGVSYLWMQPTMGSRRALTTIEISTATASLSFYHEYNGVTYNGGTCGLTLPLGTSPADDGKYLNVADEVGGISSGNRGIIIFPSGGQTINGQSSLTMKIERMSLNLLFRNGAWKTI